MAAPDLDIDALIASTPAAQAEHELDALIAQTPPAKAPPGRAEAFGRGGLQGASLGYGDEIGGAMGAPFLKAALGRIYGGGPRLTPQAQAEAAAQGIDIPKPKAAPTLADAYREVRDKMREQNKAAEGAHGGYYLGGNIAGGLATAPLLPGLQASKGAGLLARMGVGAANGLGLGALGGLGTSNADLTRGEGGQAAIDTAWGGGLGLGVGASIPAVGALGKALARGIIKPTAEAQALRKLGVNLTVGQMNPESSLAQLEEVNTSAHPLGKSIEEQRQAGRESWQRAVLPGPGAPADRLASQYQRLGRSYERIGQNPAQPIVRTAKGLRTLKDMFQEAVGNPAIYATEAEVSAADRFLSNEVSGLDRAAEDPAAANRALRAADLLKTRSNIRAQIREALRSQDYTKAKLLGAAEDEISQSLEQQLPETELARLRATDAAYGQHKVITDTLARAGDKVGGFTPSDLAAAVKAASERSSYARGEAGGPLRTLAQQGKAVLDAKVPATGARLLARVPGSQALSYAANLAGPKKFLLGEAKSQKAVQAWLDSQRQQDFIARALRSLGATASAEAGELHAAQ